MSGFKDTVVLEKSYDVWLPTIRCREMNVLL